MSIEISDILQSISGVFIVSLLWGLSNPLLKRGSAGIEKIKKTDSKLWNTLYEFWFLFSNLNYLIPFLVNMSGSVMFYMMLANYDVSIVAPVANTMTLVVSTLFGQFLGEEGINRYTYFGILLVMLGVYLCATQ
eukprot:TRINITY_DN5532_c0_g1_i1.p1 TRINITY_DN5532_c0_g1~~TRINITY_DN5532_c0_g1_i1.p1  ORF type:complete len:134 (-),score=17.06 TRINITY_DN5532_c0_g1_i1:490-891(-)